ncbi:MAG: indolepyruvate ferredoxin oxidoreductase family protein [Rhodoferax sp.]|uniref:indolepyruvate ferredoxin oxidoreductase family protein n=1 Tax=Rhodoferax sp. TaxID=50421 RepID=UPI00272EFC80|nr:indolepyruvate ferredoxin oxidoreductase family protein [Rhodoferax sp.]MDP1531155.1 indolepyruvate ferredoxin oxidoreductase family protein [Rhodoferax sp.]MDP1942205.1 indolepyruvate ferredoxin oxidoreductase family protein [Rhodoferax sp.]
MSQQTPPQTLADVSLDNKYVNTQGQAFMSGMQALVRLPLTLHERGARAGKKLGGYISGYRGSPVGTYDMALWAAQAHLDARDITFQAGVNEELAATAVWGSQQVHLLGDSAFDGVFGLWYGKAPGVDRSIDVLRHANQAGSSPQGGVLAIAGDDPNAVSSTVTGCSDYDFVSVGMPVLYPASVQDMLDFGVMGIELSKYSGCWVGYKAVTDIAESSAIVDLDIDRVRADWPELQQTADVHIRWPDNRVEQERRLYEVKLAHAKSFARFSGINRISGAATDARIGIISAGKPWADLMQALHDLGLSEQDLAQHGVRLLKLGMIYPLDAQQILEFTQGLETVLVVEEKRALIEDQLKSILFGSAPCPVVLGKLGPDGQTLIPQHGETSPALLAQVLARSLPELVSSPAAQTRLALLQAKAQALQNAPALAARTPYFCSGCPHNSSTQLPEGSIALAGIGCHWLTLFMDRQTETFSQMGGEGVSWLGAMNFSSRQHVFTNLGDGTYHHSGILAVRAAVYAKANISYKLLYNDAVAMTGGQAISDTFSPQQIVAQLLAEGVGQVVVVSDHPEKYQQMAAPNGGFPQGVTLHGRDELDGLQRKLRDTAGVTVLLYDQTCAAEKRRRRKRGTLADPDVRAFINEAVCEGCGDCSVQSNCISIEPLETELGRKRQINQSSCNKDTKCVDGFCPSFVTLAGARPRKSTRPQQQAPNATPPSPPMPAPRSAPVLPAHETVITGIGGTGVITIGAILAMAARLEGLSATCLDQTGIAQKNGAVLSHVRIARDASHLHTPRVATANADLVLACDMMVAASPAALATMTPRRTRVALNTHLAPHAAFVLNPVGAEFGEDQLRSAIDNAAGAERVQALPATRLATQLFGDAIAANMLMLGYALQQGWLPVSLQAIQRAIEINGVAVAANLAALDWGRRAALDLDAVLRQSSPAQVVRLVRPEKETLETLIARRSTDLVAYQNQAYAARFETLVRQVQHAEQQALPGSERLTRTVLTQAYRLMAIKDEYEVARLYTDGRFEKQLREQFEGDTKLSFHLAPPLFAKRDPATGHFKKKAYGPWVLSVMRVLTRFKGLRGGWLDPFGQTAERRLERSLAQMYPAMVAALLPSLTADNHAAALKLAGIGTEVRGFGHVKERQLLQAGQQWRRACRGTAAEPVVMAFVATLPGKEPTS